MAFSVDGSGWRLCQKSACLHDYVKNLHFICRKKQGTSPPPRYLLCAVRLRFLQIDELPFLNVSASNVSIRPGLELHGRIFYINAFGCLHELDATTRSKGRRLPPPHLEPVSCQRCLYNTRGKDYHTEWEVGPSQPRRRKPFSAEK